MPHEQGHWLPEWYASIRRMRERSMRPRRAIGRAESLERETSRVWHCGLCAVQRVINDSKYACVLTCNSSAATRTASNINLTVGNKLRRRRRIRNTNLSLRAPAIRAPASMARVVLRQHLLVSAL
jgi:Fe-S-cluster-containing dehydrogenase component